VYCNITLLQTAWTIHSWQMHCHTALFARSNTRSDTIYSSLCSSSSSHIISLGKWLRTHTGPQILLHIGLCCIIFGYIAILMEFFFPQVSTKLRYCNIVGIVRTESYNTSHKRCDKALYTLEVISGRVQSKYYDTRWCKGGELKAKLANGVDS
jgi:hypothetical protein